MTTATTFDLKIYLEEKRSLIEACLAEYLAQNDPPVLWESMRYSVLSGGKRLRAILCLASAEAITGQEKSLEAALPCACVVELVHAMSLIHDDLPALDNDDLRRGKPTNHRVFGEAMALLAGDALLMLATELLIEKTRGNVDPTLLLAVVLELSRASGGGGMVGGQVLDMSLTGESGVAVASLESMHKRKTGALIRFSTWSGACLAGASAEQLAAFGRFGEMLGLAFQIADDLLDVTGDIKQLGKTPGKDQSSNKVTWVTQFGMEESQRQLLDVKQQASDLLISTGLKAESIRPLAALLEYAVNRTN